MCTLVSKGARSFSRIVGAWRGRRDPHRGAALRAVARARHALLGGGGDGALDLLLESFELGLAGASRSYDDGSVA